MFVVPRAVFLPVADRVVMVLRAAGTSRGNVRAACPELCQLALAHIAADLGRPDRHLRPARPSLEYPWATLSLASRPRPSGAPASATAIARHCTEAVWN